MQTRKLVAAGVLSASLIGGGAVGALLGAPTITGAQETEESPEGPRRHRHLRAGVAAAAEALGLSVEELRGELADGSTIADVAGERGVAVQAVVDAMVTDATAAIDEKVASGDLDAERAEAMKTNLAERVTAFVNGEGRLGGRGGPGHHRHRRGPGLEAAAGALGMSVGELRGELADGATLAEVAGARGVEVQTVIDAMVAEATDRITAFVHGDEPTSGDG